MEIQRESKMETAGPRLLVVGVGGAGGNAVDNMLTSGVKGVEFIAVNTDIQGLGKSAAPLKLQIGREITRGLGAQANPDKGEQAALEDREQIKDLLNGSDMVFVTAGMGGGTGSGAAPVIAQAAKEVGALTVAVVTTPFEFEGRRRMSYAHAGLEKLKKVVDTIILVPNTRVVAFAPQGASFVDMLKKADSLLSGAVGAISDLINKPGLINVDFADARAVMEEMGLAHIGAGQASGGNRAKRALAEAVKNPLLTEITLDGARSVLLSMTVPSDATIEEIREASNFVHETMHEGANIIWGCVSDEDMGQEVRVTIIVAGIASHSNESGPGPGGKPLRMADPNNMDEDELAVFGSHMPYKRLGGICPPWQANMFLKRRV
jgi:cell division protein FtsZ